MLIYNWIPLIFVDHILEIQMTGFRLMPYAAFYIYEKLRTIFFNFFFQKKFIL